MPELGQYGSVRGVSGNGHSYRDWVRTGALSLISGLVTHNAKKHPRRVILLMAVLTAGASAFINNTPVVVMLLPVTVALAHSINLSPSKLLIPLSYMTVLGGLITLIGTSTNLFVNGMVLRAGLPAFHLFDIAPLGIIFSVIGLVYLWIFAPILLPDRVSMTGLHSDRNQMKFFTEVVVPERSPIIGKGVMDVPLFQREGMRVIDVLRGDESLRREFPGVTLAVGDRVVLCTGVNELLGLKDHAALEMVDRLSSRKTTTVEALISPGCHLIGRSLGSLRLRRRYGVYPLAAHRRSQNLGRQLDDVIVRVGDTLLLEGSPEDIRRLAADVELVDISEPSARAFKRNRAPIAIAVLVGVVALSTFDVAPIFALALLGVTVLLATGTLDADEAFGFVDAQLIVLLIAMLAVSEALEKSGAVTLLVDAFTPWLLGLPTWAVILTVYMITMVLTELISNSAVAVVMTPIAINLGVNLGVDPRPLVVAVMFAASAAFATPIGYQTNTMVYGPSGYKFTDFTRIGLPLNLILAAVASYMIPILWPF